MAIMSSIYNFRPLIRRISAVACAYAQAACADMAFCCSPSEPLSTSCGALLGGSDDAGKPPVFSQANRC